MCLSFRTRPLTDTLVITYVLMIGAHGYINLRQVHDDHDTRNIRMQAAENSIQGEALPRDPKQPIEFKRLARALAGEL